MPEISIKVVADGKEGHGPSMDQFAYERCAEGKWLAENWLDLRGTVSPVSKAPAARKSRIQKRRK